MKICRVSIHEDFDKCPPKYTKSLFLNNAGPIWTFFFGFDRLENFDFSLLDYKVLIQRQQGNGSINICAVATIEDTEDCTSYRPELFLFGVDGPDGGDIPKDLNPVDARKRIEEFAKKHGAI